MHIDPSTHEHGASVKVYRYEGDYEVADDEITWTAEVSQGGAPYQTFSGVIPISSPAVATLAEQAVRDAIMKRIDSAVDQQGGEPA